MTVCRRSGRGDERGVVAVYAVAVGVVLTVVGLVVLEAAALVRVRHEVASAADLAALAAAQASVEGREPCLAARSVARRNGASLVRCRMDYDVATVTARASSQRWWGHRWATEQDARAAPDFYLSPSGASARKAPSSLTAPALSSGSLPLPHLGE